MLRAFQDNSSKQHVSFVLKSISLLIKLVFNVTMIKFSESRSSSVSVENLVYKILCKQFNFKPKKNIFVGIVQ